MYDVSIATLILLGSFILLLVLRVPVTFALGISAVLTALYVDLPLMVIVQKMVKGIESPSLMAIPFFILAGEIMSAGGISRRLIEFANVLVGRVRGGLAQVNVLSSMFFGGISGSAVADTSSIGAMLIPMMKKNGYDDDYSVAVTVTSSCQGVIIPPSHNMIIYSLAAGGLSVGKLFLGGFIPGVVLGLALMIISYIIAVKRNYPKGEKVTFKEGLKVTYNAFFGILTAVIIMGGVLSGIFTATESAAIACVYAFIITFFVYREIPLKEMSNILYRALKTLALVLSLIATAKAFGHMLALLQVPALITNGLLSITENKILLLILINILVLVLGMIMDMAPLILILTPILLPVVTKLGMDPVQFGVVLILNLGIGLCTPPVGGALFVGCAIGKVSIEKMFKALIPFYAVMIIVLMIVTFVPEVVMYIPNLVFN
jgi:tripartite ATP-independent transporter DctM subunit